MLFRYRPDNNQSEKDRKAAEFSYYDRSRPVKGPFSIGCAPRRRTFPAESREKQKSAQIQEEGMKAERIIKDSFPVIGKEGTTEDGEGFIQKLWAEANGHFDEVAALAAKDADGNLSGCFGAMSSMDMSFRPWEDDFSRGRYLAGIEAKADALAPAGWTKWIIPGFEYVRVLCEDGNTFADGLRYLQENGLSLAGAVHDFTDPKTGENYMYFPIRKL